MSSTAAVIERLEKTSIEAADPRYPAMRYHSRKYVNDGHQVGFLEMRGRGAGAGDLVRGAEEGGSAAPATASTPTSVGVSKGSEERRRETEERRKEARDETIQGLLDTRLSVGGSLDEDAHEAPDDLSLLLLTAEVDCGEKTEESVQLPIAGTREGAGVGQVLPWRLHAQVVISKRGKVFQDDIVAVFVRGAATDDSLGAVLQGRLSRRRGLPFFSALRLSDSHVELHSRDVEERCLLA